MPNITRYFAEFPIRFEMDDDGQLWLHAGDVCLQFDIKSSRQAVSRLKDSQKITVYSKDSVGRPHKHWYISPQGMYKLAWTSRKPEAEAFTDWCADVIEELRQLGLTLGNPLRRDLELLKRLILAPDKRLWIKRFQDDIFARLEWFRGKTFDPQHRGIKWHAGFLSKYVYECAFGVELYRALKEKCPNPRFGDNLHQQLSDQGLQVLADHLVIVHSLLYGASSYQSFKKAFKIRFAHHPIQLGFDDGEHLSLS